MTLTDLSNGIVSGEGVVTAARTVGDLAGYWADAESAVAVKDRPLYRTYAWNHSQEAGAILWGSTVLHPGRVGNEFSMTRGHRHTDVTKGELMITVSGTGWLLLKDDQGVETRERLAPGSTHHVDGRLAHRAVNDGDEPLVFLTAWDVGCGHDYESVLPWPGVSVE
ncbi:cupin domain-containing protein [bacterium]|nr:MAG: cupin domain-containing protein [bacterium]